MVYIQHDRSILHLDLKPGNVLLTWDDGALMFVLFFLTKDAVLTFRSASQSSCNAVGFWDISGYDSTIEYSVREHGNVSHILVYLCLNISE